jgi:hypothetical protein
MMRNIFKLILFTLVLNIATGIMSVAIVDASGNPVFQSQDMARVPSYDASGANSFTGTYTCSSGTTNCSYSQQDQTVSPGATADTSGNIVFRLLDLVGLGFINKLLLAIDHYLFGFVILLDNMFGQYMTPALHSILFPYGVSPGLIRTLIMIGYLLAAFELWTNKTIVD